MSASDANVFPPKNTAYRLAVSFRKNDGTLVTGWTGAASVVATDTTSGAGGTPTEIGSTGLGYLDLTANQMNGELIQVVCTVTNTDALPFVGAIYTGGVAEITTAVTEDGLDAPWDQVYAAPTTLREALSLSAMALVNENVRNGATQTIKDNLGVDAVSAPVQESETQSMRGQFT